MLARGVDRVEVIAAAMYIAVFLGVIAADVIGGAAAALVASAVYMVLRFSAIEVLGTSTFAGLFLVRMLSYLSFGVIGGLSWRLLRERLNKLESFDSIDDATHLLNARGMAEVIDHEVARGRRYEESFVVSTVQFSTGLVGGLKRKERANVMAMLGSTARESVRGVDRVGITTDAKTISLVILSPLTTTEGALVLTQRITASLSNSLLPLNVAVARKLNVHHYLFPRDATEIGSVREQLLHSTAIEFPGAASVQASNV